jgi:hypothetical protein
MFRSKTNPITLTLIAERKQFAADAASRFCSVHLPNTPADL